MRVKFRVVQETKMATVEQVQKLIDEISALTLEVNRQKALLEENELSSAKSHISESSSDEMEQVEAKLSIDTVPEFNPGQTSVERWIKRAKEALKITKKQQRSILISLIINKKLKGMAQILVSDVPQDFEYIKIILRSNFSGNETNCDLIEKEADMCVQRRGEKVNEFSQRFTRIVLKWYTALETLPETEREVLRKHAQKRATKIFVKNLLPEISKDVWLSNPRDTTHAMEIAKELEMQGFYKFNSIQKKINSDKPAFKNHRETVKEKCGFCGYNGHNEKNCWKKNGKPQGFQQRDKRNTPPQRVHELEEDFKEADFRNQNQSDASSNLEDTDFSSYVLKEPIESASSWWTPGHHSQ